MFSPDAVGAETLFWNAQLAENLQHSFFGNIYDLHAHLCADFSQTSSSGDEVIFGRHIYAEQTAPGDAIATDNPDWRCVVDVVNLCHAPNIFKKITLPF